MRIGYEYLLPGAQNSGVEVAIHELLLAEIAALTEDRFEVFASSCEALKAFSGLPRVKGRVVSTARHGRIGRAFWQQNLVPWEVRRRGIDVYHATGYVVSPFLPIPSVVSVYDTIALDNPRLTRWLNAAHYGLAVPRGVRAASRVVVPSSHVKKRLIALTGVADERVEVVPLGVSERFARIASDEARARLQCIPQLGDAPFILFVGNLERKKNLGALVSVFAHVPCRVQKKLKLVLAGRHGNDAANLMRLTKGLGLTREVVFPGYVPHDVLVALYARASLLAYPSLDEGFGFPPLEAMRCGTPVVASRAGALPEVVGDAALLFDPLEPKSLLDNIDRMLSDAPLSKAYSERGLMRASAFTWHECATRVMEIYRSLVPAHTGRRVSIPDEVSA